MKKLRQLKTELLADLTCDAYELAYNPGRKQKTAMITCAAAAVVLGGTQMCIAANFFDQLGDMLSQIYGWILGVSSGLAVVLVAVGIVRYMAAGDPQSAKLAKDNIKRVLVAWICINMLGALASVIKTLTAGNNFGGGKSNYDTF